MCSKNPIEMGQKFGRLTVAGDGGWYVYQNGKRRKKFLCLCECGNYISVEGSNLKSGNTKSCGCMNIDMLRDRSTTHGGRRDRLYSIWTNMKQRCLSETNKSYNDYGGRGITICDEWIESYASFMKWAVEHGYDESLPYYKCSLDRIDVNGPYSPDNCRWVDSKEQARNRRNTIMFCHDGKNMSLSEWADATGIKYHTLFARIYKLGWDFEKAINKI